MVDIYYQQTILRISEYSENSLSPAHRLRLEPFGISEWLTIRQRPVARMAFQSSRHPMKLNRRVAEITP